MNQKEGLLEELVGDRVVHADPVVGAWIHIALKEIKFIFCVG